MAQDPNKPKDDGKIKLPSIDQAMNKKASASNVPADNKGGKGYKAKPKTKRRKQKPEPAIEATSDEPDDLSDGEDEPDEVSDQDKKKKSIMLGAGDNSPEDDADLLTRIRKRFERCISNEAENRKAALDDLRFKQGKQWPPDVAAQRATDRRPCLTINKLPTFIHQITNDQRQNRPAIHVAPVGDKGDKDVAKMYRGMIRAIERDSAADIAYDTAFESAVSNGWGYIRLLTEYESDDSTDSQVLVIRRVRNPFSVYFDPNAMEPDGADARYAFVTEMMPKTEFEDEYPDAQTVNWDMSGEGESYKSWLAKDEVRVCEYYEITTTKRERVILSNGADVWKDEIHDDVQDAIDDGRITIEKERVVNVPKLMWYKVTAVEVLDRAPQVFKWIPIVPVIGEEIDVEGKVQYSGVIRNAKDAQRMYNYWVTSETELVALAPRAPWVVEEGQIEGYESQWKNANIKNLPYLQYKGTSVAGKPAPPPSRQQPPQIPAGIVQAKQGSAQDMMATTGIRFDATMNERMMDESGKAVRELRRSGDIGNFHYMDNLGRSLRHLGRIMVSAIPDVYDTKRVLTILREDGSEEAVTLDPDATKPFSEEQREMGKHKIFNPKAGKYGVTVVIGPSYATKRIEAAESMMDFARALPNTASLIADLIAKNQDWDGAEEMATRLAKAIPPNLLTPDQKDVPPQLQAVMQNMDQQIKMLVEERQKLIAALTDKTADRAQQQDKIDKDFEAKIFGLVEKATANANTHMVAQFKEIVNLANAAREAAKPDAPKDDGDKEPKAA